MAWPMLEWVLDTHYRATFGSGIEAERSLVVYETAESALVPLMQDVERRFEAVKVFSLPSVGDGSDGRIARRHIELGVKGPPESIAAAYAALHAGVLALGAELDVAR
jgi:molybdopterin-biosynthesis enzyme MoeA-like protein